MSPLDLTLRLLLAAGLGAAIGIERELHRKPAGLRTNTLIAVGAALFTTLSVHFGGMGGTPDRIAAQVVTGVGFWAPARFCTAASASGHDDSRATAV
jgi:putative Mg2+ transporter-C (MgtC) family protein